MLTALKSKITDDPYVIGTSLAQVLHTWHLMVTALKRKIADDPYVGGTLLAQVLDTQHLMLIHSSERPLMTHVWVVLIIH